MVQESQPEYFDGRRVTWGAVAWLLTIVVTALLTYGATTSSYDRRISVLESQQHDNDRRSERIEAKIDKLEAKIDQLLSRTP
jgi:peptidoglycan hydrolase CwlO-like protein